MKNLVIILLLVLPLKVSGQTSGSNVEFIGYKNQVLLAKKGAMKAPGKLSSGDVISVGCEAGSCFFRIEYKGRTIEKAVGEDITQLAIYEYDFGGDGDNEIVVINDYKGSSFMFIYSYSRGIIQELFKYEIRYNLTVIKKEYIECSVSGGEDALWNFYQGQFWKMIPYTN